MSASQCFCGIILNPSLKWQSLPCTIQSIESRLMKKNQKKSVRDS